MCTLCPWDQPLHPAGFIAAPPRLLIDQVRGAHQTVSIHTPLHGHRLEAPPTVGDGTLGARKGVLLALISPLLETVIFPGEVCPAGVQSGQRAPVLLSQCTEQCLVPHGRLGKNRRASG